MIQERTDIERDERARCLLASHRHYQEGSRAARSREALDADARASLSQSIVHAISDLLLFGRARGVDAGGIAAESMSRVEAAEEHELATADSVLLRLDAERVIGEGRVPAPILLGLVRTHGDN